MNIVITGAGRGIGFECCKKALSLGHRVIGISRNTEALTDLKNSFAKRLHIIKTDLSNELNLNKTIIEITSLFDNIDLLVNNAGLLLKKSFVEIHRDELAQVYNTNVFTPFLLTQGLVKQLSSSKQKHVVNISSMGGINGSQKFSGLSAYSSSKGALITLTECLAEELKDLGIRCNSLAIGAVDTQMLREAFPDYSAKVNATEMADYILDFSLRQPLLFNGKVLQVSFTTP